jgi:hypothetical protein
MNSPDYQWRPATQGDVGSVARFSDFEDGGFFYGILTQVVWGTGWTPDGDEVEAFSYHCDLTDRCEVFKHKDEQFVFCWIQYDANKEP